MKNSGQVVSPYDAATKEYVDNRSGVTSVNAETGAVTMTAEKTKSVPKWSAHTSYSADGWCVHNGELWHNTSGTSSTGVEPGTDYTVWNVTYSNENLLDNPWFTVNQRGAVTYSVGGYGVDRWKLVSGTAVVTENGIQLNGTLRQTLDISLENGVNASVKLYSGTAIATYYNATKQFDIVSSGGIIRSAKLERGAISTLANDLPPDDSTEFVKCVTSTADPGDAYANKRVLTSGDICTVTLAGTFDPNNGNVTIVPIRYTTAVTKQVLPGNNIYIVVGASSSSYQNRCAVTLNGTSVLSGAGTYTYTVTKNCTVTLTSHTVGFNKYYTAEIVTE